MTEKDMQVLFGKYIRENPPKETEVYELKICKGKSLRFDCLKEHQVKALKEVEAGFFYHKISDPPVFYGMNTQFNIKRPFDCFALIGVKPYVVIWFFKPNQAKVFIKIKLLDYLNLWYHTKDKRLSFTEEMLLQIPHEKLYYKK
jgi:hypothetical protein